MILIEDTSGYKGCNDKEEDLKPTIDEGQTSSESTSPSVSPDKLACIRNQPLHTICESSEMSESNEYRSSPWINNEAYEKSSS